MQTVKQAADNKMRLNIKRGESSRCSACFVLFSTDYDSQNFSKPSVAK